MEKLNLKLSSWQSRIAKDFLGLDRLVDSVTIDIGVIKCPASYKIPFRGLSRWDWILYLTDEQLKIIQEKFKLKAPISGINITQDQLEKGEVVFHEKSFKLDLHSWQKRIVQNFIGDNIKATQVIIKPGAIYCPASYKIPVNGLSKKDWVLYLDDDQLQVVKEEFNLASEVSGIIITEGLLERQEIVFQ
jgi:hypothetical protein